MRQSDFNPGIVIQHIELDPAVLRAQRMQELRDLAEWRHRRLNLIKEWSDPVKRAERQARFAEEHAAAQKIWAEQLEEDNKPSAQKPFFERIHVRPITNPRPLKWYQRLWRKISG